MLAVLIVAQQTPEAELWGTATAVLGPTSGLLFMAVIFLWRQLAAKEASREALRLAKDAEIKELRDEQDVRDREMLERLLPLITEMTGMMVEVKGFLGEVREVMRVGLNARDLAAFRRLLRERP